MTQSPGTSLGRERRCNQQQRGATGQVGLRPSPAQMQRDHRERRTANAAVLVTPVGEVGEGDVREVLGGRVAEDGRRRRVLFATTGRVRRHDGAVVDVHDRVDVRDLQTHSRCRHEQRWMPATQPYFFLLPAPRVLTMLQGATGTLAWCYRCLWAEELRRKLLSRL